MSRSNRDFIKRFRILDSQENTDEIVWTCSSSDSENYCESKSLSKRKSRTRKRKTKKNLLLNISNLDVTITNASKENQENRNTSPILKPRLSTTTLNFQRNSKTVNTDTLISKSPILLPRTDKQRSKSPILISNTSNVRKNLFKSNNTSLNSLKTCITPIVSQRFESANLIKNDTISDENQNSLNVPNKTELVERANKYFKRTFSTDSLSQHSISECSTPKNSSKTSDEVEIVDCTQGLSMAIKQEDACSSYTSIPEKSKKVKYKKDGLAYRLDSLLKKQNANISLWQHEHYLANNSSFILPKGTFSAYRIKKVNFKFGSVLLLAVSDKDEIFIILINNLFIKEKIEKDVIIKIYEPYKVLDFNDKSKLIVNVCKYVCEPFLKFDIK